MESFDASAKEVEINDASKIMAQALDEDGKVLPVDGESLFDQTL